MSREKIEWSDEVRKRLSLWFFWSNGNHMHLKSQSTISAMIKRAAGELPGDETDVPRELTFELEATEKALARMKLSDFPRDKQARDLLIDIYLHGKPIEEIERERHWDPDRRRIEQWRAESIVGRYMIQAEKVIRENLAKQEKRA